MVWHGRDGNGWEWLGEIVNKGGEVTMTSPPSMMREMSKTTVFSISVAISGDPPIPVRPATNSTAVQPVATTIVGTATTIQAGPA
jgi:hypothetical protein